jgi:hypothetical protein
MNLVIIVLGIIAIMALPITNGGIVHSQNASTVVEKAQKSLGAKENETIAATVESSTNRSSSLDKINENTRTIKRLGDFIDECASLVNFGDRSRIRECDAVSQKFVIDMGKFIAENKNFIEGKIYPYTVPSDVSSKLGQDSRMVVGRADVPTTREHGAETLKYLETLAIFSEECAKASSGFDFGDIEECNYAENSMNVHLREFNSNTQNEFDAVLGS